jgi:Ca-activated chloride channel family protein
MGPDPLAAARVAAERGVRIYTVGFGTAEGARVGVDGWVMDVGFDEATLKSIADLTRGEYFRADSAEALQRVYRDLGSRFIVERKEVELGAFFAAAAALLTVLAAALTLLWFHRVAA